MNEDNRKFVEQNEPEWQAPPLPEEIADDEVEPAQMSEVGTLGKYILLNRAEHLKICGVNRDFSWRHCFRCW